MAQKDDIVIEEGEVAEILPGSNYLIRIYGVEGKAERIIKAYLSGKMKKNFIKIVPGDLVKVEVSAYDLSRGRIIVRQLNTNRQAA